MRIPAAFGLLCLTAALAGCGHGKGVDFVASNPDSVILDFSARPPGELVTANETATQQCQLFSNRTAVLESLNVRGQGGVIRATYLCKGPQTAAATTSSAAANKSRRE